MGLILPYEPLLLNTNLTTYKTEIVCDYLWFLIGIVVFLNLYIQAINSSRHNKVLVSQYFVHIEINIELFAQNYSLDSKLR